MNALQIYLCMYFAVCIAFSIVSVDAVGYVIGGNIIRKRKRSVQEIELQQEA